MPDKAGQGIFPCGTDAPQNDERKEAWHGKKYQREIWRQGQTAGEGAAGKTLMGLWGFR